MVNEGEKEDAVCRIWVQFYEAARFSKRNTRLEAFLIQMPVFWPEVVTGLGSSCHCALFRTIQYILFPHRPATPYGDNRTFLFLPVVEVV